MTMTLAPDLRVLSDEMLERFWARASDSVHLAEDLEELSQAGYLLSAVPVEFGGLGGNLLQVCDQQRRLAHWAPATAVARALHLAWTGAAADLYRDGDASLTWLLEEAAAGEIFSTASDHPEATAGYLTWTQCIFASVLLGMADRALELCVMETRRRAASVPQPRVQHAVAEMAVLLEGAWSLTEHMAHDWTAGVSHGERWMAKLAAVEQGASAAAVRVVELAVELTGGLPELERLDRDARSFQSPEDSLLRDLVGKSVLG